MAHPMSQRRQEAPEPVRPVPGVVAAAAAPTLLVAGTNSICVSWTLPPGASKLRGTFLAVILKVEGTSSWLRVDAFTGRLDEPDALPIPLTSTDNNQCIVKGVDPECARHRNPARMLCALYRPPL